MSRLTIEPSRTARVGGYTSAAMPSRQNHNIESNSPAQRVASLLTRYGVRNTHIVVAFSGGADSTALLLCLHQLQDEFQLELTAAHLDHALRPESADDARFAEQVCQALPVPIVVQHLKSEEAVEHVSEQTARNWRRDFLRQTARDRQAAWVATAHTADDQAETILHRIVRGTGLRGLAGISATAPLGDGLFLLRPLLKVSRGEIEAWLQSRDQSWRIDATNAELHFTRNRLRHQLLPLLRTEYNPQVNSALLRLAQQAGEVSDWLAEQADLVLAAALVDQSPTFVRLRLPPLQGCPPVVIREVFVRLWQKQAWREQGLTAAHWEQLASRVQFPSTSSRWQLPHGIEVERDGQLLRLRRV
ncbi:MAG: tRNA lysidine(34) synthetase TilS [Planctomycetaceae bacterium]